LNWVACFGPATERPERLGEESPAPGAKIVFEAKNERGFDSRKQQEELEM